MSVNKNPHKKCRRRKSILFFIITSLILTPFFLQLTIPVDFNSNNSKIDEKNWLKIKDHPKISANEIIIITPENTTYTGPMSGYYPGTHGYEDIADGSLPTDYVYFVGGSSPEPSLMSGEVISYKTDASGNRHDKVIELADYSSSSVHWIQAYFLSSGATDARDCTIEFYNLVTKDSGTFYHCNFGIRGDLGWITHLKLYKWSSSGNPDINYFDGATEYDSGIDQPYNQWYRYSIDISCDGGYAGLGAKQWRFRVYDVDGTLVYISSILDFEVDHPTGGPCEYRMTSSETQSTIRVYIDAIGITGLADDYQSGDNSEEGLVLSFENNTNLDWIGYSLSGQDNKTIIGNTTISLPFEGIHTIQIFANNTSGVKYNSNKIFFTVGDSPPPPPPPPPPPDDSDDSDDKNNKDEDEVDFLLWLLIILLILLINIGIIVFGAYVIKYKGKKQAIKKIKSPEKKKSLWKSKRREKKKKSNMAKLNGYINCPFCFNKIRGSEQFCPYCGSPLSKKIEGLEPSIPIGLGKKETDIYNEDDYYEKIFLQSSNILKIWIFDAKNKTKLYEETLESNFTRIEQKYIDITNIINADYEKNKIIEESFEFENNTLYLYIYDSNNPVIFVLFSAKKFDKEYLEFIVNTIKGIDENYRDLSEDPLEMKKFLDENIFLFNSRKYNQISTIKKVLLNKIFKAHKVREEILKQIPKLPVGTFEEFLRLYELLTEELKFAKTIDAINNTDYFEEGGFK